MKDKKKLHKLNSEEILVMVAVCQREMPTIIPCIKGMVALGISAEEITKQIVLDQRVAGHDQALLWMEQLIHYVAAQENNLAH